MSTGKKVPTLGTLIEFTLQEVFDYGVTCLMRQGAKSYDNFDGCMYRGPQGRKCAVGFFISDEEYRADMEKKGVSLVLPTFPRAEKLPKTYVNLLSDMQAIHDNVEVHNWRDAFDDLANKRGLNLVDV